MGRNLVIFGRTQGWQRSRDLPMNQNDTHPAKIPETRLRAPKPPFNIYDIEHRNQDRIAKQAKSRFPTASDREVSKIISEAFPR